MAMQTSSSLRSMHNLRGQEQLLSLSEIIEQTEKLQNSNLKIGTLLARHDGMSLGGNMVASGMHLDRSDVSMRRSYCYADD